MNNESLSRHQNGKANVLLHAPDSNFTYDCDCLMSTFREFREILFLYYDTRVVSDEEFVLLYETFQYKNSDFPYRDCSWFDLEEMDEAECKAEFRVKKKDLTALAKSLFILP